MYFVLCPLISSSTQPSKEGIVILLFQKTRISKVTPLAGGGSVISKPDPVQGVAGGFGIIGAEPPQTGDGPLWSSDTWEVGVLPPGGGGGGGEEVKGSRGGAALEGVFVSCFLESSRKETPSHFAALRSDELCSSLHLSLLHPLSSGGCPGGRWGLLLG